MADDKTNSNGAIAALEFKNSVKKEEYSQNAGLFNYLIPAYGYNGREYVALPQYLPASSGGYLYHSLRDMTLLSTIEHEGVWSNAVNIATQKAASWGWEVTSEIALRQKRAQELIQDFEWLGIADYTTAISASIKGYLLTGRAFIEIERATSSRFSKVVALHHLDPMACMLTGDPRQPVNYMDTKGNIHELKDYEVGVFVMNPSPIERPYLYNSRPYQSATEAVYDQITQMEAIWRYLYEKTTGKRALSIDFITGMSSRQLQDMVISADADMERKSVTLYKGSILVPIAQADAGISHVRIDLAGLPDGFDFQKIYDNTIITYASALGLDVNDLDPRLAQKQSLGSGTQANLLDSKTQTKGLVIWRQQFTRFMQRLVLDDATSFSWRETSTEELTKEAEKNGKIITNVKTMIEAQIITNAQGLNILVDEEVLPREFLDTDLTQGNSIGDDEKDIAQPKDPNAPKPAQQPVDSEIIPQGDNQAQAVQSSNGGDSIPATQGEKKYKGLRLKHMPGRHNQKLHTPFGRRGADFGKDDDSDVSQQGSTSQQATAVAPQASSQPTIQPVQPVVAQPAQPEPPKQDAKPVATPKIQPLSPAKGQYADFGKKVAKGSKELVDSEERKEWKDNLSEQGAESIATYTSSAYEDINNMLRGKSKGDAESRAVVAELDNAIESSKIPFDVSVYRGCRRAEELRNFFANDAQIGGEWSDPAYMSTSLDKTSFGAFKGADVSFKINVPKGSSGAFLNGDLSAFPNEAEMLLPRGTRFRIDKIVRSKYGGNTPGGTVEVTMTVIP